MSRKDTFLEKMNEALSWELAGIVQYMNHATMLTGTEKSHLEDFFEDASEEALDHSQIVGHKISALGGVPTVEPARIRQAAEAEGMLEAALKLEREALKTYEEALEYADASNQGTKFWLEDHISEEQEHVDELVLLTNEVSFGEQDLSTGASQTG